MEKTICDLCQEDIAESIYSVRDVNYGTPGQYSIVRCRNCGLVYLSPRPGKTELQRAYPERIYDPFAAIFATNTPSVPTPSDMKRARWLTAAYEPGRVLDAGCGNGLFLKAMQELGWTCRGVEPNLTAARFGQAKLRLDVTPGDIFSISGDGLFDLVTLWDVLEHTPSPTDVLIHARRLLARHGKLALSVPNWDSIERRVFRDRWIALDAPRHMYHFTPNTLTRLLVKSGYEVLSLEASAPVVSLASNVLRFGGDLILRGGRSKVNGASSRPLQSCTPSVMRLAVIQFVHVLMTIPNLGINLLRRGATLTIVAQKAPAG